MFDPLIELYRTFADQFLSDQMLQLYGYAYNVFVAITFIWAPLLMWAILEPTLKKMRRLESLKKMEFKLLEISIPKEINKSPFAMEIVLQSLHHPFKNPTRLDDLRKAKIHPWFSLEIVSTEGAVRFFVNTPKDFVQYVKAHLYSQYPDLEIREVDDYVSRVPFARGKEEWDLYGNEFKLTKPDPYPIKTYVDYGLDKLDLKEEFKIDPMTVVVEYMGAIGRGQHAWLQIMVQAHVSRYKGKRKDRDWKKFWGELWYKPASEDFWKFWTYDWWTPPTQDWSKETEKIIKEIQEKAKGNPSSAQKNEISAMERAMKKLAFDVGIRGIYIAKKEHYDAANVVGLSNIMKQYSSLDLNGFEGDKKAETKTDPKSDPSGEELKKKKKKMFEAYLTRSYFYSGGKPFVLNTEELATIYHFPGKVSATPKLTRLESKRAEPPTNLPV